MAPMANTTVAPSVAKASITCHPFVRAAAIPFRLVRRCQLQPEVRHPPPITVSGSTSHKPLKVAGSNPDAEAVY
jgi:hypothetical protein